MLKIMIKAKTENGKKVIDEGKPVNRGGRVIQRLAGIDTVKVSDYEVIVSLAKFDRNFAPMLIKNYHKIFEKLGAVKDVDYEVMMVE